MPTSRVRLFLAALALAAATLGPRPALAAEPVPTPPAAEAARADADVRRIGEELAALRKLPSAPIAAALRLARDGNGDVRERLVRLGEGAVPSKTDAASIRAAIATVDAVRALAAAASPLATRQLVAASGDHGGAFRPEIARLLKALGDKAVPALLSTKKGSSPSVRAFAFAQLEAMGKRVAGDAVQTEDAGVLADVLAVFGETGDLDALPVVLSFVNADRAKIRDAARAATLSYGQEAQWKVRETFAIVTGAPASEAWSYQETATRLFAAYDRLRQKELYDLHEKGVVAANEGRLEEATVAFDAVLARQPLFERRADMAAAYVTLGEKLEETNAEGARAAYLKALRLAPESARAPRAKAGLAYLEGMALEARGIEDERAFRRVVELDPGHPGARAWLTRREEASLDRQQRFKAFAAGGSVLLVGVLAAVLFGSFRRRSARAT